MLHVLLFFNKFSSSIMEKFVGAEKLKSYRLLDKDLPTRVAKCNDLSVGNEWFKQKQLNHLLEKQKCLLEEPRIDRLSLSYWKHLLVRSNLSCGQWIPEAGMVEVTKCRGKCLSNAGTVIEGKKMIFPEEALFLMDMKHMEVYYNKLPLSLQEAFGVLLQSEQAMLKYQAYAHLCRLGYTVIKHSKETKFRAPTDYERKINLNQYTSGKIQRTVKSAADGSESHHNVVEKAAIVKAELVEVFDEVATPKEDADALTFSSRIPGVIASPLQNRSSDCILSCHPDISVPNVFGVTSITLKPPGRRQLPPNVTLSQTNLTINLATLYSAGNLRHRAPQGSNPRKRNHGRGDEGDSISAKFLHRHNYRDASVTGYRDERYHPREERNHSRERHQNPSWRIPVSLPGGGRASSDRFDQQSSGFDSRDRHPPSQFSRQPQRVFDRSADRAGRDPNGYSGSANFSGGRDGRSWRERGQHPGSGCEEVAGVSNKEPPPRSAPRSVCRTKAKSWSQYKLEQQLCSWNPADKKAGLALLMTNKISPLVLPNDATSTAAILSRLQIVPQVQLTKSMNSVSASELNLISIDYDVYLPDSGYRKKVYTPPNHRLVVLSCFDDLPELPRLAQTARSLGDAIPIHFAVVDNGDIAFYSFSDVCLPVQITMG